MSESLVQILYGCEVCDLSNVTYSNTMNAFGVSFWDTPLASILKMFTDRADFGGTEVGW